MAWYCLLEQMWYQMSLSKPNIISSSIMHLCMFQGQSHVAVLGASGGIGQPLSLLLKNSPFVSKLTLYDIAHTPGVAADLSHICTKSQTQGFLGPDQLHNCLEGAQLVLIPAGVPRKPGKTKNLRRAFSKLTSEISYVTVLNCYNDRQDQGYSNQSGIC